MNYPILQTRDATKLAGKYTKVGKHHFRFGSNIKMGGQAIAIPLENMQKETVAYFRAPLAIAMTEEKIHRAAWMIGQRLHQKSAAFAAVPQLWLDSREVGRPQGISFDFFGTIHGLAKGDSWKTWKEENQLNGRKLPPSFQRVAFAKSLIWHLASFETMGNRGFIHGDLSDGNLMLDADGERATLIDFDCFVCESPSLKTPKLMVRQGGSIGTRGYMPVELEQAGTLDSAPIGDRFARDMLLIELLGFSDRSPFDASPIMWKGQPELQKEIEGLAKRLNLEHLLDPAVFTWSELERPTSFELAKNAGLKIKNNTGLKLDAPPLLSQKQGFNGFGSDKTSDSIGVPSAGEKKSAMDATNHALEALGRFTIGAIDKSFIWVGKHLLIALRKTLACRDALIVIVCLSVIAFLLLPMIPGRFGKTAFAALLIFVAPFLYHDVRNSGL